MKELFTDPELEIIYITQDVICFSTDLDPWDDDDLPLIDDTTAAGGPPVTLPEDLD